MWLVLFAVQSCTNVGRLELPPPEVCSETLLLRLMCRKPADYSTVTVYDTKLPWTILHPHPITESVSPRPFDFVGMALEIGNVCMGRSEPIVRVCNLSFFFFLFFFLLLSYVCLLNLSEMFVSLSANTFIYLI